MFRQLKRKANVLKNQLLLMLALIGLFVVLNALKVFA